MAGLFEHSERKYRSGQVLRTSASRAWRDVAAEHRQHPAIVLPENEARQTEICIATRRDQRARVTRKSNGLFQDHRSEAGMVWLSPIGVVEEEVCLTDPLELLHIYLPASRFDQLSDVCGGAATNASAIGYVGGVRDDLIEQIGSSVLAELKAETAAGRVLVDSLALSLTARLAQTYSTGSFARVEALKACPGLDAVRLSRVLDYIREHIGDDLGIEDMARVACLSPFHFTRMFRNSMGVPPHRYMVELRLERAKFLLAKSNESLVEIALAICFSSQSNFTRAFRQATGMTPGEYRRGAR